MAIVVQGVLRISKGSPSKPCANSTARYTLRAVSRIMDAYRQPKICLAPGRWERPHFRLLLMTIAMHANIAKKHSCRISPANSILAPMLTIF